MTTTATIYRPSAGRRRAVAPGFTLIELLVVLLILSIISAMVVVGLSSVLGSNERRVTEGRLALLETMVENYRQQTTTGSGQGLTSNSRSLPAASEPAHDFPIGDRASLSQAAKALLDATPAEPDNVLSDTQLVMRQLLAVPANRELAADQPADFLQESFRWPTADRDSETDGVGDDTGLRLNDFTAAEPTLTTAVPTDAQDNVILFASSNGLIVDGDGLIRPDGPWWNAPSRSTSISVVARDGRPFFFSAGADGNPKTHEDNVYSRPVVGFDVGNNVYSE